MSVQITTVEEARRVLGRGLMQTTEDVALTRLEVAGLLADAAKMLLEFVEDGTSGPLARA